MFKVLLYYDAFDKLVTMVSDMKKIGIDVDSHQSPHQVLTQAIEFNTDFVVLQAGTNPEAAYITSSKLIHLAKKPTVILIKNKSQKLDPEAIIANDIAKVFTEPLDFNSFLAYMLEVKGYDPVEYFGKYLQVEYKPKKLITAKKGKIEEKFTQRNYAKDYARFLNDEEIDLEKNLSVDKINDFKKNQKDIDIEGPETERERFMKALLENQK